MAEPEFGGNLSAIEIGRRCMITKVGINGFGRIGRNFFRAAHERSHALEIAVVNDLTNADTLAHLLNHDSILGRFPGDVKAKDGSLIVDGQPVSVLAEADPSALSWGDLGVDLVVEATGVNREKARLHLRRGAKKVVISAPARDSDLTVCVGVNHTSYDPARHQVISNASCTTNCLAPLAMVLHDRFGIECGLMTTVHAYTSGQQLLDGPHKDRRRARAAACSIVPAETGAASALSRVLPALEGRLGGMALRVPVPAVSLVDLTVTLELPATAGDVNEALRSAAADGLRGILGVCDEELVSVDFVHDDRSSIVDAPLTMAIGDRMVKVVAWYDNEWGYACRLLDLVEYVTSST
jgi:glyceraldehyde 3-phosphate dehydrogenase